MPVPRTAGHARSHQLIAMTADSGTAKRPVQDTMRG
jgi:hypothetical protein